MEIILRTLQTPCEYEDLSLDPPNSHKKLGVVDWSCNTSDGEVGSKKPCLVREEYPGQNTIKERQRESSWNKQCLMETAHPVHWIWTVSPNAHLFNSPVRLLPVPETEMWELPGGLWGHALEGPSVTSCLPLLSPPTHQGSQFSPLLQPSVRIRGQEQRGDLVLD